MKPLGWQYNNYSIHVAIYLAKLFSTDALNANAKLPDQELFEVFGWYATSGALISYSISPVSFEFPTGTVNIGYVNPARTSIFFWNSLLWNWGYLVLKISSTQPISVLNQCFNIA